MTELPNSYYWVTLYVASGQSLELASSTEPQPLNTTCTDNRHRRPYQLDRRPSRHLATSLGSPILSQRPTVSSSTGVITEWEVEP
jgi:hypothetical protein